ncbi:MAG: glycosyltransferase family 2 protein [Actinomycetota bacterium]
MSSPPDLSIVIPVYDAADTVSSLVQSIVEIEDIATQIILVDDLSTDGSREVIGELAREHADVTALFHEVNRGAGHARNTGFDIATGTYVLFFDADDVLHAEALRAALRELDRTAADLAMTPYHYRRTSRQNYEAMNAFDAEIWNDIKAGESGPVVSLRECAQLLQFSAYPWNKVLRTARYRATGLAFGSTPVHNDVLGHWMSLLFARSIVLVDDELCTHIVESDGSNLTNQHSRVRLTLIEALDETYDLLSSDTTMLRRYSHQYWGFALRTASWALARVDDGLKDEFKARFDDHLMRMRVTDYRRMRLARTPGTADAILRTALR